MSYNSLAHITVSVLLDDVLDALFLPRVDVGQQEVRAFGFGPVFFEHLFQVAGYAGDGFIVDEVVQHCLISYSLLVDIFSQVPLG